MTERDKSFEKLDIGKQIVIFIGPEGSGKTSVAEELAKETGKPYITTGGLIRELSDVDNGFILDGGLRTVHETADFQKMLNSAGRTTPLTVVYLDIPLWTSFERLFTGENARKRVDGNGSGDTKGGVSKRLSQFYFKLEERLKIIRGEPNWKLIKIDATPDSETVLNRTRQALIDQKR